LNNLNGKEVEMEEEVGTVAAFGIIQTKTAKTMTVKREIEEEDEEMEEERIFFSDPSNLTKTARKRMRKKVNEFKFNPEINFDFHILASKCGRYSF
jgi:hypothetical protein